MLQIILKKKEKFDIFILLYIYNVYFVFKLPNKKDSLKFGSDNNKYKS